MKGMVAHTPSHFAGFSYYQLLLTCVTLNAHARERHAADRTAIECEVKHCYGHGFPPLDLELCLYFHLSMSDSSSRRIHALSRQRSMPNDSSFGVSQSEVADFQSVKVAFISDVHMQSHFEDVLESDDT